MRIGELARDSGMSPKAIRYYESVGLLPPAPRLANGYRDYAKGWADRLAFIRTAQSLGLTLGEIRGIMSLRDQGTTPCEHVASIIERHAAEVSTRIADLERLRRDLVRLARKAHAATPRDCEESNFCHVIEDL